MMKEKKEITLKTTVKAIITGYIAYGVIFSVTAYLLAMGLNDVIDLIPNVNHKILSISIPLMEVVIVYIIIHAVCRLSIYDVFKKCKTNAENLPQVYSKLKIFIIICIIFYTILSVIICIMNLYFQKQDIVVATYQYSSFHSEEFVTQLSQEMYENYNSSKVNLLTATTIMTIGVVSCLLHIISYQKKNIERYNS